MNINKPILLLSTIFTLSYAGDSGELLLKKNCATCHILTMPSPNTMPNMTAPAMEAVLFHVKDAWGSDEKVKKFIVDYVQNPKLSKTVCESNKVAKFGLMPSLKDKVSIADIEAISDYLIKTYPSKKFVNLLREMQRNDKINALINSPFLINKEELPHLTKILIEEWDKGSLGLTDGQKKKLLIVRKETILGVRNIKKILKELEPEIIEMLADGESTNKIRDKVDEIAKLKSKATMIQLKCIKDSIKILNDKQLYILLPFWDV